MLNIFELFNYKVLKTSAVVEITILYSKNDKLY